VTKISKIPAFKPLTQTLATAALGVATTLAIAGGAVLADGPRTRPMVEIVAGTESALTQGGMNVLIRVGVGVSQSPEDTDAGDMLGPEQLVWAHLRGDFSIDPSASGANALPYLDMSFIPVHNQLSVIRENGDAVMGDLQLLPTRVTRDIRLDRSVGVKVSVVGIQLGTVRAQSEHVSLYAQLAADAIGYKMAAHVSSLGTFHGFHLAGLGAEAGAAFLVNENFTVRVALGGNADVNFGGNVGSGFAVQSDMDAYLAVKADIAKFIQVFVRAGLNAMCDSGESGCQWSPQFMAGATFIF
jgi:hypothetical protein